METPVSFRGLYGHIGVIVQRCMRQSSSLSAPGPCLGRRGRAGPILASPPPPPPSPLPVAAEDLPGYVPHNSGPYRTLPRNLDLDDPLLGQFIRGIANIRLATTQIDGVDTEHMRLLAWVGFPHLGGGIPAAHEARRALRAAEQELHEAFEAALGALQQNRTDGEQLEYLGRLLQYLEGWITDSEAQAANHARRMDKTVVALRQANASLRLENEHLQGWIKDSEAQMATYARRLENTAATLKRANTLLRRQNQMLMAEVGERDVGLRRRTLRIQYLECEVGEYAGYS